MIKQYYVDDKRRSGKGVMRFFTSFNCSIDSLYVRQDRLNTRWLSPHRELLSERAVSTDITINDLEQADFVIFIRYLLLYYKSAQKDFDDLWFPRTSIKGHRGDSFVCEYFELFVRGEVSSYFNDNLKLILDIKSKEELELIDESEVYNRFKIHVKHYLNYALLETR